MTAIPSTKRKAKKLPIFQVLVLLSSAALCFNGCSAAFSSSASRFADDLSRAFENNSDIAVVEDGAPAYLLMMDAFVGRNPKDFAMARSAAKLNAAYAEMFVEESERSKKLTEKALRLAFSSACLENRKLCDLRAKKFEEFEKILLDAETADLDALFTLGSVWAGWIQARQEDWNAVAELAKVEAIMRRTTALAPEFKKGEPYLYLGVMATLLPPALGGKSEEGREYFEKAIKLSEGRNLYAKYLYAQKYARLVFDRPLHDRLLQEILDGDPEAEGYTLANTIAREKARLLLQTSDDYF